MNLNLQSIEPLIGADSPSSALQKPIQVLQPIPSASASSLTPYAEQSSSINPLPMVSPVSSAVINSLATNCTLSLSQTNNLQSNVNAGKPIHGISSSPYMYQSVPVGQPILLTSALQSGLVFAQPSGAPLGTPYMIAHPKPSYQVRGVGSGQAIPMAVVVGAPTPGAHPSLIHLQQQSSTTGMFPVASQPMVCANPGTMIQSNLPSTAYPQIHPGVAVAHLPNSCPIAPSAPSSFALGAAITTTVNSGAPTTRSVVPTPDSVLRQLNEEIVFLERLSGSNTPLTGQQANRLQRLIYARDQVLQSIATKSRPPSIRAASGATAALRPRPLIPTSAASILPAVQTAQPPKPGPPMRQAKQSTSLPLASLISSIGSLRQPSNNLGGNPVILARPRPDILPMSRTEVLNLLAKHRLLPINNAINGNDRFMVEFRLSTQRYQLWLNRAQKADLEQLLHSFTNAQCKAEILTVYQQEQGRYLTAHPRIPGALTGHLRFIRPAQSQQPHPQHLPGATVCVLAPVAPTPSQNSITLSPVVPSTSKISPTTVNSATIASPNVPQFTASTFVQGPTAFTTNTTPSIISPILSTPAQLPPQNQLSVQQSRRLTALRTMLHADQLAAVSRPHASIDEGETDRSLPSLDEMINLLAPYHVTQDMDNSVAAMAKVDDVLDKAFHQLFTRKQQTEDAVHSIMYAEKWQQMDCPSTDRIAISRLALQADRDQFASETAAYEDLKRCLVAEPCSLSPKRLRCLLEEISPDFVPLEFDDEGNSRPATIHLEEEDVRQPPILVVEEKSPPKCELSGVDGAWPEWKDQEFMQSPDTLGIDFVVDDLVNTDEDPCSPIPPIIDTEAPELSSDPHINNTSVEHPSTRPSIQVNSQSKASHLTEADMPFQRLRHSEDPTIDAAIRSIIDL